MTERTARERQEAKVSADDTRVRPAQGEVERLRRLGHSGIANLCRGNHTEDLLRCPNCELVHYRLDALADLAKRTEEENERALSLWQTALKQMKEAMDRCDEMMKERDEATRQLAESEARVQNEIAARRLAQEHGIGDRARIEELESERDEARGALAKWGHVAACECGHPAHPERRDPRCSPVTP